MEDESTVLVAVQANCAALQDRVRELEQLLQTTMAENLILAEKAARATALEEQVDRFREEQVMQSRRVIPVTTDIRYEEELERINAMLREKLDQVTRERDDCMQGAVQTKILREMNEEKNRTILELNRQIAELQMNLEVERTKQSAGGNEEALRPIIDDLISKNANLEAEKSELRGRNKALEDTLARTESFLNIVQAENKILDYSQTHESLETHFQLVESRAKEMSEYYFKGMNDRVTEVEQRMVTLENAIQRSMEMNVTELQETISDLRDEIRELHESDASPQLLKMAMHVAELEEENSWLRSQSSSFPASPN